MPRTIRLLLLVAVIAPGGCAASDPWTFEPHPADVTAARPGADAEPVHTVVSILPMRRPDDKGPAGPPGLSVRIRVENTSPFPVTFDPGSMVLLSGGLVRFHDPIVEPPGPRDLPPGGNALLDARFPFPGDGTAAGTDLSGLDLRWTLVIDGHPVTSSASFTRQPPEYLSMPSRGVGVGYQRYPQ